MRKRRRGLEGNLTCSEKSDRRGEANRLPGSSLAPSARRDGVTAGGSRSSAEETKEGKGAFCAPRGRSQVAPALWGQALAPARVKGS